MKPMFIRTLRKSDGRDLHLYGYTPIVVDERSPAPSPEGSAADATHGSHLRWHPFRGEWVVYAGHRQHRTFLPPPEHDPFAPTLDPAHPTELPQGAYDVAVFENRFPTLRASVLGPPHTLVQTAPAGGTCEVVVFTQERTGSLGTQSLARVELVVGVWAERTRALGARSDVTYVMPFENRGVEVGVTLPHPHGQIYAYPFVPPIPERALAACTEHYTKTGRGLLETHIAREREEGTRVVHEEPNAVAFVPAFARYAYELWIAPTRAVARLDRLGDEELTDFARSLKSALLRLDALWDAPMPYVLVVHQAPTDGDEHPESHVHVEIYPAFRMPGRLKYLAGSELGAGTFTADTLPDEKAQELRALNVRLDDSNDAAVREGGES